MIIVVKQNDPNSIDGGRLYILGFRPPKLPLNSTRSLAFHFGNTSYLQYISTQHKAQLSNSDNIKRFDMSNDIPNDWFLVKLTRWEDGHETSSALLPVNISAGDTPSGLRNGLQAVYKRIWDYFTVIERDGNSSDRTNLPLGAAIREGDGIEGLCVDWQGLSAGDWPSQRTLVTEFNLPGIVRH
ncbi:hypothetical protein BOTNAR_0403g00070 [Botryotinia narcissicola]|uniref:Uncharacterized protein n=1 Tax=Botryotinia narcissicola TaxID=278944 RepID=A0A4Z1HZJ4_9HELO|nr:hypothetical protein BOTNAR_0403g00070 [Botryotinia narcissicola]